MDFEKRLKQSVLPYFSGMGRGSFGGESRIANETQENTKAKSADLVLLCGVPCDFRLDYGSPLRRAKVISINRSRIDVQHNLSPDLAIVADPSLFYKLWHKNTKVQSNKNGS